MLKQLQFGIQKGTTDAVKEQKSNKIKHVSNQLFNMEKLFNSLIQNEINDPTSYIKQSSIVC